LARRRSLGGTGDILDVTPFGHGVTSFPLADLVPRDRVAIRLRGSRAT
jgi:hypothetical protein